MMSRICQYCIAAGAAIDGGVRDTPLLVALVGTRGTYRSSLEERWCRFYGDVHLLANERHARLGLPPARSPLEPSALLCQATPKLRHTTVVLALPFYQLQPARVARAKGGEFRLQVCKFLRAR